MYKDLLIHNPETREANKIIKHNKILIIKKFVNINYSIIPGTEFTVIIYSIYDQVFSSTDAKLHRLKNNLNFVLKLTLKSSYMFWCENTIIREHTI
jgi:hypothetical protein